MAQQKVTINKSQKTPQIKGTPVGGGTGRRKAAIARVWARRGSGSVIVNGQDFKKYFDTSTMILAVEKPFSTCSIAKEYDFQVSVIGGGKMGQSQAVQLGVARALLEIDETLRPLLRQNNLLTVDSRIKERKKYGQKGARRKFQFVKR
jgi:small subunit ribosomal protein S9